MDDGEITPESLDSSEDDSRAQQVCNRAVQLVVLKPEKNISIFKPWAPSGISNVFL